LNLRNLCSNLILISLVFASPSLLADTIPNATVEPVSKLEVINLQTLFYIISPIGTFLAVFTAYYAIYRQTKPSIAIYYEPNPNNATVIDLVIKNIGTGTAKDISFSIPLPIRCWGITEPGDDEEIAIDHKIPFLSPNKELRFLAGQYAGLSDKIGDGLLVTAEYKFRSPLRSNKKNKDDSQLDINYMQYMTHSNSVENVISDALKGRNGTIFMKMNTSLNGIESTLKTIVEQQTNTIEESKIIS
jgi:hypothetical protein